MLAALLVGSLLSTAGGSHSTSSPTGHEATPKLVCKTGSVVLKDGRVKATGGCTFKSKPVGKWSWVNPSTVDAAGTPCVVLATGGQGSSFEPKPKAQMAPVFTLRVPKTRFYRGKVLRVGGKTLTAGWDSCGTPLEIISLPEGTSPLCVYVTDHGFDTATRALRLGKVGCPSEFGECKWESYEKYIYNPTPDITVYGGRVLCANGYSAVSYAWLNSGCIRFNATAVYVLPSNWGGRAYGDLSLLTMDASGVPLQVRGDSPGEPSAGPGFVSWERIDVGSLHGTKPFC